MQGMESQAERLLSRIESSSDPAGSRVTLRGCWRDGSREATHPPGPQHSVSGPAAWTRSHKTPVGFAGVQQPPWQSPARRGAETTGVCSRGSGATALRGRVGTAGSGEAAGEGSVPGTSLSPAPRAYPSPCPQLPCVSGHGRFGSEPTPPTHLTGSPLGRLLPDEATLRGPRGHGFHVWTWGRDPV